VSSDMAAIDVSETSSDYRVCFSYSGKLESESDISKT
jgi:hypothetical protein